MRNAIRLLPAMIMMAQAWHCIPSSAASLPERFGTSLSLDSAIQIGLKNNPEIEASEEKINASRGRFWSGISPAPADISMTNDYIPSDQNVSKYGEKTVGISQTLEFPTTYYWRGSKYSIEKKMAEIEFSLTKLGVIAGVKKSYFHVLALLEQVRLAEQNSAIAQDFVKKAEVRHSVGDGTNLEKLTARVTYSEALNNVEIQKNHLKTAYDELNLAMGFGKRDSHEYMVTDSLGYGRYNLTLNQLLDETVPVNPVVEATRLRVHAFAAEKKLAWSACLPGFTIGLFGKQVRGDATEYYGASLGIGIPLWFMLDQRGRIVEASSNVSAAEAELKKATNTVYTKTIAAYTEFKHEEKRVELYIKEILPQAEEIYRTALKSYEAGEITYLEFLQAQQTFIASKGSYTDALLSYNLSIVTIEETIGKTLQ